MCPQFEAALQQHLQHYTPAVAVQFDYVFAGEAGGGGEVEQEAVVDGFACGINKIGVERAARLRGFAAADLLRQRQQLLAG